MNQLKGLVVLLMVFLFVCSSVSAAEVAPAKRELTVSPAISLKTVFMELSGPFEKSHPGVRILFNFGGSGQLKQQIESGAPVDVFASAAQREMDELAARQVLVPSSRTVIASNRLVLIVPSGAPQVSKIGRFADLASSSTKRIAIGNPKTVPAGAYADQALRHEHLLEAVHDKLIFSENVRQVVDYVARGEVDAGFVYRTDAKTEKRVKVVQAVPGDWHQPIEYPVAVLKSGKEQGVALEWVKYLSTAQAQSAFTAAGFEHAR